MNGVRFFTNISQLGLISGAHINDVLATMPDKSMGIFYVSDIHKIAGLPVETQCNVIVTKTTKTVFRIELNNVWTGETWEATYASGNTVSSFIARASKDNLDALAARVTALENS